MNINNIYVENHISLSLQIQMNHFPLLKSDNFKCGFLTEAGLFNTGRPPKYCTAQITPVLSEQQEPQKLNDNCGIDQSITELTLKGN